MAKRVFELAEEMGVMSKDIVEFFSSKNIKKNNFSKLEVEEIDLIKNNFNNNSIEDIDNNSIINLLQKLCRYKYDKNLFFSMLASLSTNQLIVLDGKPGYGKSTFVKAFANVIGAECASIPVQANWVDKTDLLGYYNPVSEKYVPTPFLDTLIDFINEAKKDKNNDKLYIINLDEMNLSHVEYYFADFLSKLQEVETERVIELYSQRVYDEVKSKLSFDFKKYKVIEKSTDTELDEIIERTKGNDKIFELKQRRSWLNRYKAKICIPPNVKFVGTINNDATTQELSPKVVDRSIFLRIRKMNEETDNQSEGKRFVPYTAMIKYFNEVSVLQRTDEVVKELLSEMDQNGISEHVHISRRFYNTVRGILGFIYYLNGGDNFTEKDKTVVNDLIISGLILPKIMIDISKQNTTLPDNLRKFVNNYEQSKSVVEEMISENDQVISYWR